MSPAVLTHPGPDSEIQYTATATATASRVLTADITVGTRLPAAATSLARVLLPDAFPDVRARGHALVDQELESGLRSIAVPVRDRAGRVTAAVDVATHAARRTPEDCVKTVLPELTTTTTHIQTDLHTASRFTAVPVS
ncbi:IclR family transcriptional regulator C-terminal domain-containing protein [Streptomyces sp. NPDC058964]|uniref:IclR family transcriptional regulator domain-containing protein n=1 Tax=Streptomyces sp. NPDC058964 TaxID=3346681 RepID=UPI0036C45675